MLQFRPIVREAQTNRPTVVAISNATAAAWSSAGAPSGSSVGAHDAPATMAIATPWMTMPRIERSDCRCFRSEERSVGEECVSTFRFRWLQYHLKTQHEYSHKHQTIL